VIGFEGKLCASAEVENIKAATTQKSLRIMIYLRIIVRFLKKFE